MAVLGCYLALKKAEEGLVSPTPDVRKSPRFANVGLAFVVGC
jgi:hypothetical protein